MTCCPIELKILYRLLVSNPVNTVGINNDIQEIVSKIVRLIYDAAVDKQTLNNLNTFEKLYLLLDEYLIKLCQVLKTGGNRSSAAQLTGQHCNNNRKNSGKPIALPKPTNRPVIMSST